MNWRNRHEPYNPYKNVRDAIFDIRQPTQEDKRVNEPVVAHNSAVEELRESQQRYELLSTQEKQRVNYYLRNVFDILGVEPGQYLDAISKVV